MPDFTTPDGCRLYFELNGDDDARPTVVFLNGTAQTTTYWYNSLRFFKDRFRVLLYDARAQGRSDLGDQPLTLKRHVSDLKMLLDHLEIARVYCIGLSHGARIALFLALRTPPVVERLVLCSFNPKPDIRADMIVRSWLEILRCADLEAMAWAALPVVFGRDFLYRQDRILGKVVQAMVLRNKKEALMAHLEALRRYPPVALEKNALDQPCLILSGDDDPLVSRKGAEHLAALCTGRHERLAGIGHSIPVEAPELFNRMILDFLTRSQPG